MGFAEMRSSIRCSSGRINVGISGVIWAMELTTDSLPLPNITVVSVYCLDNGRFRLVAVLSRIMFVSAPQSNRTSVAFRPSSHLTLLNSFLAAIYIFLAFLRASNVVSDLFVFSLSTSSMSSLGRFFLFPFILPSIKCLGAQRVFES